MRALPQLRYLFLLVLLPSGVLLGCGSTTNLVTGETQRGAYTWQEEVQIGRENDPAVIAQFGLYEDAGVSAYVERIGQDVLQTSAYSDPTTPAEIRGTPFHFRVLDSPVVNAMALPGGYIYVTRGLLAHLDNEAQLSVVLGHEIGHVLARHASRRAASAQLGQLGLLGAAVLGGVVGGGNVAEGILNYGGAGVGLLFLSYGREDEREADRAGVAYSEFAGYDAAEAADFFGSLARLSQQGGGGGIPSFLSTHPDPGERQQSIPQLAAQYQPRGTEVNAAEYLSQIDNIVLGNDPRQGYTEGGRFYHPELRFQFTYPDGWQVNNTPSAVQIGEPNGRAVLEFSFAQASSAQAAGQEFGRQQGVAVSSQSSTTIGSNRSYRVEGSANTSNGEVRFLAYFIEYGGNVFRFMGLAAANSFNSYSATMRQSIESFARLTNQSYINRQPVRLDVVRADRSAPFSSFVSGRPTPEGLNTEGLAIMNQVQLNTTVPSGYQLKLPGR